MATELVNRLRGLGDPKNWSSNHAVALCDEAANEIASLQAMIRVKDADYQHVRLVYENALLSLGHMAEAMAENEFFRNTLEQILKHSGHSATMWGIANLALNTMKHEHPGPPIKGES